MRHRAAPREITILFIWIQHNDYIFNSIELGGMVMEESLKFMRSFCIMDSLLGTGHCSSNVHNLHRQEAEEGLFLHALLRSGRDPICTSRCKFLPALQE